MQAKSIYLAPLLLFSAMAGASPQHGLSGVSVKVFTQQHYPIQQAQYADAVYHLDKVENLEESFLTNLSGDPVQAEQQVRQVMNTPLWQQFETKLRTAYQDVIEGWKLGVMKIPAVVFETDNPEENAVIYGETNVAKAIELYKADLLQRRTAQ